MNEKVMRRSDEPAHVIAAKNLADVYVKIGGKRSVFLEEFAKKRGYASWNAYSASAQVSITIPSNRKPIILGPGLFYAEPKNMWFCALSLISAAKRDGYSCDFSAPVVISDDLSHFASIGAAGGLCLRKRLSHRSYFFVDDIRVDDISEIIADQLTGHKGLIIMDVSCVSAETMELIAAAAPGSLIIAPGFTQKNMNFITGYTSPLMFVKDNLDGDIFYPDPKVLSETDKWDRMAIMMLKAFAKSGQPYDVLNPPAIEALDPSDPHMRRFVQNIPEYNLDRFNRSPQNLKAQEHFRFITSQI